MTEPILTDEARERKRLKMWECWLRKRHGLTPASFNAMLEAQGHRCAVCGTMTPGGRRGSFCVDHCHRTGRVRGLLCTGCNVALGRVGDDVAGILRFVTYLRFGSAVAGGFRTRKQKGRPRRVTVTRFVDADGRRVLRSHPEARPVKEMSQTYFAKVDGRRISLGTTDYAQAEKRLRELRAKLTATGSGLLPILILPP